MARITDGIGAGFISFCVLKALRGKATELHPLLVAAAVAFLASSRRDGRIEAGSIRVRSPNEAASPGIARPHVG